MNYKHDYISRPMYIGKVEPYINKDIIKVLIGQRRVGKSFMLFQIMDEILKLDKEANIIYISKELDDFDHIKDHKDLIKEVNQKKT
ncbi:MAG: AAA family ATPase, partial [Bacteroidales bacterium]